MSTQLSIKGFYEVALPVVDLQESKRFYQLLGYEVSDEQAWGLVVMKRDDSQVALLSHTFFKQPAVSYWTDNLERVMQELQSLDIMIVEDDSKSQPPRISILDPSRNEIIIYQM
jgi:predicted lactoylglutathione lyase